MAVGAGSIKRASKLNADADIKKTVEPAVESVPVQPVEAESTQVPAIEAKAPAKKTTASKSTTTKSTAAKTTAKSTTTKATAKKAPAKKTAEKPVEENTVEVKPAVEASVITNIDPVVLDVVLGKKTKANKACHLTEDMPIHLL